MARFTAIALALLCTAPISTGRAAAAADRDVQPCAENGGTALQILGSGGPMHGQGRGSAAYVIWFKGRPSILVDIGGGTTTALARAGVASTRVDALLISHMHPDHVSDLPEFLWGEMVARRRRPLVIAGPEGAEGFLSLTNFLEKQFGASGSFPDMRGLLSGEEFPLKSITVETSPGQTHDVFAQSGLRVKAYAVPHGRAPALAYRIDGPDFSVVFGGDQTGLNSGFSAFATGADYLVLHVMLTPSATSHSLAKVVALPASLGQRAAEAKAKRVVLGHLMSAATTDDEAQLWSLSSMATVIEGVRSSYRGPILVASELECLDIPPRH